MGSHVSENNSLDVGAISHPDIGSADKFPAPNQFFRTGDEHKKANLKANVSGEVCSIKPGVL